MPYFANPYHYHPELELTYILEGTGIRYIGDSMEPFGPGDLVLVGSNLPHLWRNDPVYYRGQSRRKARAIVVQFREDVLGQDLWELPEMKKMRNLIRRSRQGVKITQKTNREIKDHLVEMPSLSGARQVISLLTILDRIAEARDTRTLTTRAFSTSVTETGTERMNRVLAYVFEHFSEEISLETMASITNLSPTSFCRYFKAHTNKTFSGFVIETRIRHACKLILKEELALSEIAFLSGFGSASYFTKQFKRTLNMTPLAYKKRFEGI